MASSLGMFHTLSVALCWHLSYHHSTESKIGLVCELVVKGGITMYVISAVDHMVRLPGLHDFAC